VALFDMANDSGLDLFAITDHDTIAGYLQLSDFLIEQGSPSDMRLISVSSFPVFGKRSVCILLVWVLMPATL
jgi:hypothetical protein